MKRLIFIFMVLVHSAFGTLLVNENFESGTVPTGWVNTGANFNYTASPLAGSVSLRLPHGALGYYDVGGTINNTEVWFKILFKAEAITGTGDAQIIYISDSAYTALLYLNLDISGQFELNGTPTTDTISAGTIYNIWGHYKKGTGSNALLELSFDVAGNPRPNSGTKFVTITNGTQTANAAAFIMRTDLGGNDAFVVDNVQVSDTDIFGGVTSSPSPSNRFFLFPKP